MAFCIMRIGKIKAVSTFGAIERHDRERERLAHRKHPEREHENINTCSPFYSAEHSIAERFQHRTEGLKIRSNAVLGYEVVLAYSPEAEEHLDHNKWFRENIKWLSRNFGGKENIPFVTFHADESTRHMHAVVIPIDDKGKLYARYYTGGKVKLSKLQDSYAEAMEQFGLQRGNRYLDNPELASANHQSLKVYYAAERELDKVRFDSEMER
jgi:hypothetical protein